VNSHNEAGSFVDSFCATRAEGNWDEVGKTRVAEWLSSECSLDLREDVDHLSFIEMCVVTPFGSLLRYCDYNSGGPGLDCDSVVLLGDYSLWKSLSQTSGELRTRPSREPSDRDECGKGHQQAHDEEVFHVKQRSTG
jgi:hypothetical protein